MTTAEARLLVQKTFQNPFDKGQFIYFIKNLVNEIDEEKAFHARGYVHEKYRDRVKTYERIGTYTDPEENKIDILIVYLQKESSIDRARTTLRNFVGDYLKERGEKEAGLIAFVSPNQKDWRFSLVKMEYKITETPSGRVKAKEEFTPAKRYSFLVGVEETSHTAQSRLVPILEDDKQNPTLKQIEEAFNIEKVTKEFFEKYRDLFLRVKESLDNWLKKDKDTKNDFETKGVNTVDFVKKLLGQIVFLYFLQKKGWFGVRRGENWGFGSKQFLRDLFEGKIIPYNNFFNDVLEHLFYDALARDRSDIDHWNDHFKCKIPFLNGGLFDPLNGYGWEKTDILLPNDIFSNNRKDIKTGDMGDGILDIFDRYNFTVKEDEPLEKEVAVDPEMLGKVFEHLLEVKDRKSKGTYYTPREIVHYMCQESLVNYLATELDGKVSKKDIETLIKYGETVVEHEAEVGSRGKETKTYSHKLPKSIRDNAKLIDEKLETIRICDPAVGSGAFPVGMMNEITRTRNALTSYLKTKKDRTIYDFKRHAIQNCLYGVDIDLGAVEIAKLRLWLSLIVDEEDIKQIKPLPNLDYKIMQGNSLLEEFEGIKLFDERLLNAALLEDNSEKIQDIEKQLTVLNNKLMKFYQAKPEWMRNKRIERPSELAALENEQKRLMDNFKYEKDKGRINIKDVMNSSLFPSKKKSENIWKLLTSLHKKFFEATQKKNKDDLKKQIEDLGWELIEATLKEQNKISALKKLEEFRKSNTKPFFLWKLHFTEVFKRENPGFDVVIANPPYIRQEEITYYKKVLEKTYQVYSARSDLYTYFYEKGTRLLATNGLLIFISSNKFMRAQYGEKLREYIKNHYQLLEIIDFGNVHKFDAITNTLILFIRNNYEKNNIFKYSEDINLPRTECEQDKLKNDSWTLADNSVLLLKEKIEKRGVPLARWKIKISYGIKAGYNDAFVIGKEIRDIFVKQNHLSEKVIEPLLRGRDIGRYHKKFADKYIILSKYQGHAEFQKSYPELTKHLEKFEKQLKNRGQVKNGQHHWLELDNNPSEDYLNLFSQNKIIWLELSDKNKFTYTEDGECILAGAFMITGKSLKYLLAFLNSNLCLFYFRLICNSSGMDTTQWKKFALEKVPVIELPDVEQTPFIDLVDKTLAITKGNDYLENSEKQAKVHDYEKQIDQLIYNLYGLTPEEIKIIDDSK